MADILNKLRLGREHGGTVFNDAVLLACRYSGGRDVLLASPTIGSDHVRLLVMRPRPVHPRRLQPAQQRSSIPSSNGSNAIPIDNGTQIQEVVVTAQKRAQNINNVGMSITAISGSALVQQGVSSTADLAKVVPGLTFEPSPFNTPVYTLRGVGYYDSAVSASPTVAVYTDEVPLPFSAMTKAAGLDLERVEVLKGPQGTLYGENTTGGAINYIAAKPTKTYEAGFDAGYGRFNTADVQGYLSGPVDRHLDRTPVRPHRAGWPLAGELHPRRPARRAEPVGRPAAPGLAPARQAEHRGRPERLARQGRHPGSAA